MTQFCFGARLGAWDSKGPRLASTRWRAASDRRSPGLTGVAENWLGVPGGDMWWSHADAATYRQWLAGAHLHIDEERFVPEGKGGHTLVLAHRGAEDAGVAG